MRSLLLIYNVRSQRTHTVQLSQFLIQPNTISQIIVRAGGVSHDDIGGGELRW